MASPQSQSQTSEKKPSRNTNQQEEGFNSQTQTHRPSSGGGRGGGGNTISNGNSRGRPFNHNANSNGNGNSNNNGRGGGQQQQQRERPSTMEGQGQGQGSRVVRNTQRQNQQYHPQRREGRERPSPDERDDNCCIVCYKDVKYYSAGACDHSVCLECSARMRVLMEQNECPICRQIMENVVFTKGLKSYQKLKDKMRMFIYLPKWGIYIEDETVKKEFDKLLEHRCPFCKKEKRDEDQVEVVFGNFAELRNHVQRRHEMFSCDLCVENIKLFSRERQFYTRAELGTHKRKGDKRDKSHRGHPICEFCDKRFFDSDDLYRHLRVDHYFCHFCDADGFNHYYNNYDDLRVHFRKEHFLCEEENCKEEKFTSVFRTEIDLKAHLTLVHSRLLGKHGTKQARKIDLDFSVKNDDDRRNRRFGTDGFVGGGRGGGGGRRGDYGRDRGDRDIRDPSEYGSQRQGQRGDDNNEDPFQTSQPVFEPTSTPKPKVDSVAEFPMLEGSNNKPLMGIHPSNSIAQKVALSSGKNVSSVSASNAGSSSGTGNGNGNKGWSAKVSGSNRHDEEFPALGPESDLGASASANFPTASRPPPGMVYHPQQKPQIQKQPQSQGSSARNGFARPALLSSAIEEFPSLGNSSFGPGASAAWVKGGGKRQTPRSLKVAPAPELRKVEVDPSDAFHFVPLSVSKARKDSLTKMYEDILAEEGDEDREEKEALKKKKKNREKEQGKIKVKQADALFNGKGKGGESSNRKSRSEKTSPTNLSEDFPTLEGLKESLQQSSSAQLLTGSGSGSGPPPGFSLNAPSISSGDPFDLSFQKSFKEKALLPAKKKPTPESISEDLELLKAKAGSSGKIYLQPPDFTKRNQLLMEGVRSSLNSDSASFEMFKSVSSQYKKGELESKEYYELCQDMFGIGDFRVIFPELVALLPDIIKQQELLASHRKSSSGIQADLKSCHECFQLIRTGDVGAHLKAHAESDIFPAL